MIILCKKCASKFSINEKLISASGSKVRCSRCHEVFTVHRPKGTRNQKTGQLITNAAPPAPKRSCRIISISNQKGGVSKTTTCLNLGASLAKMNQRVLVIDFDVQASLTSTLGYQNTYSFYDAIHSGSEFASYILSTKYARLDLLPSNENMILLNRRYFGVNYFEYMLRDRLKRLTHQYEYILIDTPPSVGYFVLNSLTAANFVIIPCQSEYLSTQGVGQTIKLINRVKRNTNPYIRPRVLVTMYDRNSAVARLVVSKLKGSYRENTFETVIDYDYKVKESQVMKEPVCYYDKNSPAALQYVDLAREILALEM